MKLNLANVAFIAISSSVATVWGLDFLRPSSAEEQAALALDTPSEETFVADLAIVERATRMSSPPGSATEFSERMAEFEARLAELERVARSSREPAGSVTEELPPRDDLRSLVLGWVSEERDAQERAREEAWLDERLFGARASARKTAEKYGLSESEEARIVEVLVDVEVRRRQTELSFDLERVDPAVFEARWEEFDDWADEHLREGMGPKLYALVHDEDDE